MFPGEAERLLPPLTFMNPPEKFQEIEVDGFKVSVVEIQVPGIHRHTFTKE